MGSVALEPASAARTPSWRRSSPPATRATSCPSRSTRRRSLHGPELGLRPRRLARRHRRRRGRRPLHARRPGRATRWIGGVGVVAGRRGQGIGEQLMRAVETTRAGRGASRGSGSRCWFRTSPRSSSTRSSATPTCATSRCGRSTEGLCFRNTKSPRCRWRTRSVAASERLPWQRADASVADARRRARGRGHARVADLPGLGRDRIDRPARSGRRGRDPRPAGLASRRDDRPPLRNVPEGDPVNAVLESLGATLTARQHEMVLEL